LKLFNHRFQGVWYDIGDNFLCAIGVERFYNCQGVERVNENKKEFKVVKCPWVPDIVLILNGCIPFCGG
jgi:hypothetical protein